MARRAYRLLSKTASTFVVLGLGLAGCGLGGPAYKAPSDAAATVHMSGFDFEPREVHIKAGDAVEWRNTSILTHTITVDPQHDPKRTAVPVGAVPFDSGSISAGQVFRHTFTVPGTYRYKCDPHEDFDMTGVIVVEP